MNMRKLIFLMVFALAALPWAHAAQAADEMSAATLDSFCNSGDSSSRRLCSIYILGVVQGIRLASGVLKTKKQFCIPDDISESQLVAVFQKMANLLKQAFSNDMNGPASSMVGAAMVHAFPCSNQQPIRP